MIQRLSRHQPTMMTPRRSPDGQGLVTVDATWGTIQPMELAAGVRTLGELEVVAHIEAARPLVDTRLAHFLEGGTIPGARGIPYEMIGDRIDELSRSSPTIFFCNGPQCSATPAAIRTLLAAGHPANLMLYYRGGIHDWVTLGLPLEDDRGS